MRHLRILRYVDEVARAGSIRKAADQLPRSLACDDGASNGYGLASGRLLDR